MNNAEGNALKVGDKIRCDRSGKISEVIGLVPGAAPGVTFKFKLRSIPGGAERSIMTLQNYSKVEDVSEFSPPLMFFHCKPCLAENLRPKLGAGPDANGDLLLWCENHECAVGRFPLRMPFDVSKMRCSECEAGTPHVH